MPCFGTTDRTYNNAVTLTKKLGATLKEVNIRKAVSIHFEDIGHDPAIHDVTYENGQARYRTLILMDLANKTNGMVIGTGDMSELALGWATYNGDHMSMYGVNASVPKTLVRHLVSYYADTCGDKALADVLYDVLDTPVSRSSCRRRMEKSPRRRRTLWDLTSSTTSSSTIFSATAIIRRRSTALQRSHCGSLRGQGDLQVDKYLLPSVLCTAV